MKRVKPSKQKKSSKSQQSKSKSQKPAAASKMRASGRASVGVRLARIESLLERTTEDGTRRTLKRVLATLEELHPIAVVGMGDEQIAHWERMVGEVRGLVGRGEVKG